MKINWLAAFLALRHYFFAMVLFELVGIAPSISQGQTLLGITFDDELIRIDPNTAEGTLVGVTSDMFPFGLAKRGSQLFTFDQIADVITLIDPATGKTQGTFDVGIRTFGEGSLAFRDDGRGFLIGNNPVGPSATFYEFDIMTLSSTPIGGIGGFERLMDGLAFDAAGVLYGFSDGGGELYTINPNTGDLTLVGRTNIEFFENVGGLAFAPDGRLFAAVHAELYTLDLTTGAATAVGRIGFGEVSGITFFVPEPSSLLLGVFALAAVTCLRRRPSGT